jgi:hypothetical protein
MPAAMERKLKSIAAKKNWSKERKNAFVYGSMRNTGWKPSREKKMNNPSKLIRLAQIDKALDSIIRFQGTQDDQDQDQQKKFPWLATGTGIAAGAGGLATAQALQRTGGIGANLQTLQHGPDLLGQATGNVAKTTGAVGAALHPAFNAGKSFLNSAKPAVTSVGNAMKTGGGLVWDALKKAFVPAVKSMSSKEKPIIFASAEGPIEFEGAVDFIQGVMKRNAAQSREGFMKGMEWGSRWGEKYKGPIRGAAIGTGAYLLGRHMGKKKAESNMGSKEKPIEFGSEILGPWQGAKGTGKLYQEDFPAGLSPAAVLKFPFPKLMAFLRQKNILQQVFSEKMERLVELDSKLDEVIQFAGFSGAKKALAAGAIGIGAGAAGYGTYQAVEHIKEHRRKMNKFRKEAGEDDFIPLYRGHVLDKHGAIYPENHPRVQSGNITSLRSKSGEIQFAGGYINTPGGVRKERGAGAHFNRAAGRYGGLLLSPGTFGLSLPVGYLVDRSRWKHNIPKTKQEKEEPAALGKGRKLLSSKLDNLIEFKR